MTTETPPAPAFPAPVTAELSPEVAAPQANGAVASDTQPQTEPAPQTADDAAKADAGRFKGRISDLTRDRNTAREEAAYWRGIAEARQAGQTSQAAPPPPPQPVDLEPSPDDFAGKEFDPKYLRAVAKWEGRQEVKRAQEAMTVRQAEEAYEAEATRAFEAGRTRFIEARQDAEIIEEQHPQYAGVVAQTLDNIARAEQPGTPGRLVDVLTQAENRAWVVAALATKPGLLNQVMALDPTSRALAIGKIDAQISANLRSASTAQAAQPKPAPSAIPPVQPTPMLNGKGAAPSINPDTASMQDYVRWRESMQ